DAAPLSAGSIQTHSVRVPIVFRLVPEEELSRAQRIIAETDGAGPAGRALTAEDLADGDVAARRFFAQQLVEFAQREQGRTEEYQVTAFSIGKRLAVVSLPGEPFAEIGIRIRETSPFPTTFVVSHANGACGYIPLAECFARGGYETLPTIGGGAREDAADRLIQGALAVLRR
ncbi:MAG: hypothetical protein NTW87_08455, partial [Planctomycetota bacterium]|nr:hypothetical protein [Planctomycetota bacterium]